MDALQITDTGGRPMAFHHPIRAPYFVFVALFIVTMPGPEFARGSALAQNLELAAAPAEAGREGRELGESSYGEEIEQEFELCAIYDETALAEARTRAGFAVEEECSCERTDRMCETNWRGAEQFTYVCRCTRARCAVSICAMNVVTAMSGATVECERSSCTCQETAESCEEGLLGADRTVYDCGCP